MRPDRDDWLPLKTFFSAQSFTNERVESAANAHAAFLGKLGLATQNDQFHKPTGFLNAAADVKANRASESSTEHCQAGTKTEWHQQCKSERAPGRGPAARLGRHKTDLRAADGSRASPS